MIGIKALELDQDIAVAASQLQECLKRCRAVLKRHGIPKWGEYERLPSHVVREMDEACGDFRGLR